MGLQSMPRRALCNSVTSAQAQADGCIPSARAHDCTKRQSTESAELPRQRQHHWVPERRWAQVLCQLTCTKSFAAELMIWSIACIAKLKVMNSQIGFRPAIAAPVAIPVKPACNRNVYELVCPTPAPAPTQYTMNMPRCYQKVRTGSRHLCDWCVSYTLSSILLQQPSGDLQVEQPDS